MEEEHASEPKSCLEIKKSNPNAKDGIYSIRPKSALVQADCLMESEGGGWTKIAGEKKSVTGLYPKLKIDDLGMNYNEVMFTSCKAHGFTLDTQPDVADCFRNPILWKSSGYNSFVNFLEFVGTDNVARKLMTQPPGEKEYWGVLSGRKYISLDEFDNIVESPKDCYFEDRLKDCSCMYAFVLCGQGKLIGFGDIESELGRSALTYDNRFDYDFEIFVR